MLTVCCRFLAYLQHVAAPAACPLLQGFHRKALDVANKLGISNSLLRVIERREFGDKMLVYCGMLGTLVFLFIVYRYTRGAAPPPAPA